MLRVLVMFFLFLTLTPRVEAQLSRALSAGEISKLLPVKLKGYRLKGEAKGKQVKLGELTYSIAERTFEKRGATLKILLFDYADAQIMYTQAIRKWSEMRHVTSDTLIYQPRNSGLPEWESYNASTRHSQIIMGIHDRFFLTLDGENVGLPELNDIANSIDRAKFPKK